MNIDEYQTWTRETWQGNEDTDQILHACMGLAGESGEVVDIFKKMYFTPSRLKGHDYREHVIKELGDVLYYLTRLADELGVLMSDVIETNVAKLEKRYGNETEA